ncbi:MAG: hypothetical protein HQK65_08055 [Desulfamplus sp.]|nr:hypothetical protein [Desulfamplus sp.]
MQDHSAYLWDLRTEMNRRGVIFSINGPISFDLIVGIGDALKRKMQMEDAERSTILKVFSVVVEQADNILHYSAEPVRDDSDGDVKLGILVVGREDEHYYVLCGNMIRSAKVEVLREKLCLIRGMDTAALKTYYKEQRKLTPDVESKGAGLGLIEMARKASHPIDFDFKPVSDELSFFYLRIII